MSKTPNKDFLTKFPKQFCLSNPSAKRFRKMILIAQESYPFEYKETKGPMVGRRQYYNFEIVCTTTFFADAYFHLGCLYYKYIHLKNKMK